MRDLCIKRIQSILNELKDPIKCGLIDTTKPIGAKYFNEVVELESILFWLNNGNDSHKIQAALEEYIEAHPEESKDKPAWKLAGMKRSYSLNEMLVEIRNQTEVGIKLEKGMIKLTVENLLSCIENIDADF